jgi:hypothetical protein
MLSSNRVFYLQTYGKNNPEFQYLVLLPEGVNDGENVVPAAWAYAVRYTAKGLDLPDHEKALQLLKERHSSWTIIPGRCINVAVDLSRADMDVPDQ